MPDDDQPPETAPPPVPDPDPLPEPAPEPVRPRRRGGMALLALLLLGGAAVAFAWYDPLHWRGENTVQTEVAALTARLDAAETATKALEGRLAQLESAPAPVSPEALAALEQAVKDNQAALAALQQAPGAGDEVSSVQVAALAQAVEDLKRQVAGLSTTPGSSEDIRAAVDAAMEARAAEQEAEAKALAVAAERKAARADAVARLLTAARAGAPYADLIPALDGLPLDPVLQEAASAGLVTQKALVEGFPEAARKALDASLRATAGEGIGDRLYTFLRIQTGARSLEPREGSDPDAVLSRAEAAAEAGDIAKTLEELAGLPPEGQAEMAGWTAQAKQWLAAEKALDDLAAAAAVQGG
ncbi:hypothetical protein G5B31_02850 [Rhodobacter sp. SGA-6-6]|uniref:COG4223 family protein n=1 Tax=Rhodobacter sp. SGA-6-6 TaxID=2710882 RepID=UPI0013EDFED0|nr:hypothetical protein [Rhodobacter sp. SGA-6-6]NGM44472.1 hypothetical protein [Rhodobacter sp. SGA-6-6]